MPNNAPSKRRAAGSKIRSCLGRSVWKIKHSKLSVGLWKAIENMRGNLHVGLIFDINQITMLLKRYKGLFKSLV